MSDKKKSFFHHFEKLSDPAFIFYLKFSHNLRKGEFNMDFLKGNLRPIYFKYLAAAFGSSLITSIYSVVDMAMVGQYQGPEGTAALSVVAPIWNIIYSLGPLMGIGGSVIFSILKGSRESENRQPNEYFTCSVIGSIFLAILAWLVIIFFDRELMTFFGAAKNLLPLTQEYIRPIKYVIP